MNAREWNTLISETLSELAHLQPSEFYDVDEDQYHSVYDKIAAIVRAVDIDAARWKEFMRSNPVPRSNWLPANCADLDSMSAEEIHFRLLENLADERWVDGALADAYRCGSLSRALDRLADSASNFNFKKSGKSEISS
jgi:hypothetical protein